ncbi:MAG: hypothetical protein SWE60_15105 [Thermodesulfobacteriota bacterium]|nr:hypothetical protein [Thermodesulfobacteriota bacterium]
MTYFRVLGLCTVAVTFFCTAVLAQLPTGEFQEWDLGADWCPYNIAVTLNQSIYVIHDDADPSDGLVGKVFEIKRDGTTLEHVPSVQANFNAIARGPDNTVWITDSYWDDTTGTGNRLWKMRPNEPPAPFVRFGYLALPDSFGLPADPYGVSVDSDGIVWFACQDSDDPGIGRYDPVTGLWLRYPLPADSRIGVPVEIAFDGDGDVWFTIREWGPANKAGLGKLEVGSNPYKYFTRVWVDDGGGGVFPAACRDVFGFAGRPRNPWEVHVVDGRVWYTDKTAACLVRFNPSDGTFSCFSMPTRDAGGWPTPWDAHYFDVAPDGLFWLAAFGWDAMGTYDRATGSFAHFPLDHGANPIGIAVDKWTLSWTGHAWVVETGTGRVGRFIPLPDSDSDGIPDDIDMDPRSLSDAFRVGTTTGTIDRGDQDIGCVITHTPEGDGVRVFTGCDGAGAPATVTVPCAPDLIVEAIDPCDSVDVRCGSASVRVQSGPVVAKLNGWMEVGLPSGAEMTATEDGEGALNIANLSDQETITLAYEGQTEALAPGQSFEVVNVSVDVKPGSCPNPLPLPKESGHAEGKFPIAILGTGELDVTRIDPATIRMSREGVEGAVAPIRHGYEDVATPFEGDMSACHDLKGDGLVDLTLKFKRKELAEVLDLDEKEGETIPLAVVGNLYEKFGGTAIAGQDCVTIKVKKK